MVFRFARLLGLDGLLGRAADSLATASSTAWVRGVAQGVVHRRLLLARLRFLPTSAMIVERRLRRAAKVWSGSWAPMSDTPTLMVQALPAGARLVVGSRERAYSRP